MHNLGCGDSLCWLEKPTGQMTNGGCRCFEGLPKEKRYQIISVITSLRQENKKLQEQICKQNLS